MKKVTGIAAAAALVFSGAALADDGPSYTYVQGQYNNYDSIDNDDVDGTGDVDGYGIAASLGFLEMFHVALEYNDNTAENAAGGGTDVDWDSIQLNAGIHSELNEATDFVAELQYIDLSTDISGAANEPDADAFGARFGIRQLLGDKVEIGIFGNYWNGSVDGPTLAGNADTDFNDWGLEVSGRYNITDPLSIGLTLNINDPIASGLGFGGDSAVIDVRWSFGEIL